MKCPYRKRIVDLKSVGLDGTEEEFTECYGTECPLYIPEQSFSGGLKTLETCGKALGELRGGE